MNVCYYQLNHPLWYRGSTVAQCFYFAVDDSILNGRSWDLFWKCQRNVSKKSYSKANGRMPDYSMGGVKKSNVTFLFIKKQSQCRDKCVYVHLFSMFAQFCQIGFLWHQIFPSEIWMVFFSDYIGAVNQKCLFILF